MEVTRLALLLGILGLVLLVGGGGWPLWFSDQDQVGSALVGAGTLCLIGYLFLNVRSIRGFTQRRSTRLGFHSIVSVLLALVVVVLVNFLAAKHAPEWDFSETKNFTLSRQTYEVLRGLPREVSITVFSHEGSPGYGAYQDLLTTYDKESTQISLQFIDPERQPDIAKDYHITKIDTVVLESGGQKIYLQRSSEADITNGLLRVTRDIKKRILFLTGHGEKSLTDTESPGLSRVQDALTKQGYRLESGGISQGIPPDTAALVLASATQPLTLEEETLLFQYFNQGGQLLIMADPDTQGTLQALLAQWGIQLGNGILADEKDRLGRGSPTALMVRTFTAHDITEDFTAPIIFPVSRSVTFTPAQEFEWDFIALAQTSPDSWEETDLRSTQVEYLEGQDPRGPFTVAGLLTPRSGGGNSEKAGALVVVGNAAFATNGWFTYPGNTDFFLKTIAWLAKEDALISLTPKEPAFHPFVPNPSQEQALVFYQVLFLPLLTLFLGLSVWKRRRSL